MRILVACTDAEIGGAERFLVSLARSKRADDTLALVVLMGRGSLSDQLESSFDEVHYLGFPPSSRNLPGMIRRLDRIVRKFGPDVVSSHLFHADLVVALSRRTCPRTTTVHTQFLGADDHPLTRIIARALGVLSFRFDAVVPASPSAQMDRFVRTLRMQNVVAAIPNGARVPDKPAFDPRSRSFLSLARNHPVKGHARLFEAFALVAADIPDWSLVAHGPDVTLDDPLMQAALDSSGAMELVRSGRIQLLGPTSDPEAALARASALVISSVYGEAFPIVGAEAAGLGIPVITTDLGSCSEFADDPRFLVPPDDSEALAHALREYALQSDHSRQQLSVTARERAESRYHPSVAYERYRALFSTLIAARAGKR